MVVAHLPPEGVDVDPVTDPIDADDGAAVAAERAADPRDVPIDGAAARRQRPAECLLVQLPPAADTPATPKEHEQDLPLREGQRERRGPQARLRAVVLDDEGADRERLRLEIVCDAASHAATVTARR